MEFLKSLVPLLTVIVGLATAIVVYRTTKLKHGLPQVPADQNDGPAGVFKQMLAVYGVMLTPIVYMVVAYGLLMLFVSLPTMFTKQPGNQTAEEVPSVVAVDLGSLPVEHTTLYHMGEAAAAMGAGRNRDDALAKVGEKAVKAGAYQVALAAAARMSVGRQRNEMLATVALSAASHAQGQVATAAVGVMSKGNDRNDAAQRVIDALGAAGGKALVPAPK